MQPRHAVLATTLILFAAAEPAPAYAQHAVTAAGEGRQALPLRLWRDPGDVTALDLYHGAGSAAGAPDPEAQYKFVKWDLGGTNPKFVIEDGQGRRWKAKLGQESQPEVAATRLLWASGYFVDEDYYIAQLKVTGLSNPERGGKWVTPDGIVHGARLERQLGEAGKKLGAWKWRANPFTGTKELNGLKVMMALLNNWDLKTDNNNSYGVDGERHYVVTDLGASFGKTGNSFTRSKGDLTDYQASRFVDRTNEDGVDFVMHSRPFFPVAIAVPYYLERARMEHYSKHIPRSDARWLGAILSQLSEAQIKDCFRAAGYAPEEVDGYATVVQARIAALTAL